jgi:hypothetical protein
MENKIIKIVSIALGILVVLALAMQSPAQTIDKQKLLEKSAACLDCHEEQAQSLLGTTHQNTSVSGVQSGIVVALVATMDGKIIWKTPPNHFL